jgi:hypothetical protein
MNIEAEEFKAQRTQNKQNIIHKAETKARVTLNE